MSAAKEVLARLDALGIAYRLVEHAPAHTMADCAEIDRSLSALGVATPKNIFLRTRRTARYCLCLARPGARFHTADVSKQAGCSRLGFAPEGELYARLRCRPGSASPLGLMFPEAEGVALLVDASLRDAPALGFHPCDNTMTVVMSGADFFDAFLGAVGVEPTWVEMRDV